MEDTNDSISTEWIGLIILPTVSCIAGAATFSPRFSMPLNIGRRVYYRRQCVAQGSAHSQHQRCRRLDDRAFPAALSALLITEHIDPQQTALFVIPCVEHTLRIIRLYSEMISLPD
jgi:hypothetical protein